MQYEEDPSDIIIIKEKVEKRDEQKGKVKLEINKTSSKDLKFNKYEVDDEEDS